ncbi:MAG: GDP-mannose 4,6-dehydratase [Candidatus Omnitrophica bacterium]|jgi:CDP-paratose 2-epimerase|nr:GDP-mannose 4,6-dehydratase [Candidatus Omnitrophota bacterium]
MKILITGGCGFAGSNIAYKVLKDKRGELFILDNLYREGSAKNLKWLKRHGKFTFFKADVRINNQVQKIIRKVNPDVVFHLAGQVAMTTSIDNPRLDFEVNAMGTFNVLEGIRKYCSESIFIYSSTNKVYGSLDWVEYKEHEKRYVAERFPEGFSESTPIDFHSPYGCSKGTADQYVLDYSRLYNLRVVVFRHSSIYGSRQFATYDQGWVGWFCAKAIETGKGSLKKSFTISGNGKQIRDLLFVDDMVNLYLLAVDKIDYIKGNAFNIGGGMQNSLSLLELFDILEHKLKVKLDYIQLPWRYSDQKIFVADIRKINNMCGWSPKVNKLDGINKVIEWLQRGLIDRDASY